MINITDFLVAGPNTIFLVAGCVVLGMFILELVMFTVGHSTMMSHGDVDLTLDLDGNGIPDYLEGGHFHMGDWFNPGHIPVTMFLVLFCTFLSLIGYTGQWFYLGSTGKFLPALMAVPLSLVPTLALSRWASVGMAKIIPQDETNAILIETLTGELGMLTAGPVNGPDDFGMARFTDKYGTDHRLVVGGVDDTVIKLGATVVLVGPHPSKTVAYLVRSI